MRILSLFKSEKKPTPRYEFTEEDRKYSAEIRKKKQEMELMRMQHEMSLMESQVQLKSMELKAKMLELVPEGEEEDGVSQMIMQIMQPALGGMINKFSQGTPQPPSQPHKEQEIIPSREPISVEELRDFRDSLPRAQRKWAKTAPDGVLRNIILNQMPDLSEQEISLAIQVARE